MLSPQRALLIDDEAPARDDLRRLLAAHPMVAIVAEAATLGQGRAVLERGDYDLVFLDVQLRGGTGFELVPFVRPGAGIVFVSGYDRHAVRAFEVNALDYLLKPVEPARLAEALRRLERAAAANPEPADQPETALRFDDATFVRTDANAAQFVRVRDIAAIFSAQNYTEVHLAGPVRFLVRRTLKTWEELLPPAEFMRVHRTALVNLRAVEATQRDATATLLFLSALGNARPVRARRELWAEIEQRLIALRS